MAQNKRQQWLWTWVIIMSMLAIGATQLMPDTPIMILRIITLWYLFAIPGMTFVKLLDLDGMPAQWIIAIALSISINMIVSQFMVYLNLYNPHSVLGIVLLINLAGWLAYIRFKTLKST